RWDPATKTVHLTLEQTQDRVFEFELDVELVADDHHVTPQRVRVDRRSTQLVFPAEQAPAFVLVDAGMHLLAELDQVQTQAQWLAQLHGSARAIDRIRAVEALASFPSSVAIVDPLWRAAAHDRFHAVRTAAATALGTLGDAQAQAA